MVKVGKSAKRNQATIEEILLKESNPINFWEAKQRELLTSVVDYNLGSLTQLVGKKINMDPKYQRRHRWDDERKSRLIESFLMNVPVPPVFLNEDAYGQYSVIDGKQRLTAIKDFFQSRFKLTGLEIFSDINNKRFDQLPPDLQSVLETRPTLRAIIILRQSDEDVKFEVFQRLNTGGVTLNAQEIRNSTWPGELNDLVLELSEHRLFHFLLGINDKVESPIWQEMRDAELVLRYFTFRRTWTEFKGGMKGRMDHYLADHQRMKPEKVELLRKDFINTLQVVEAAFGEYAFMRWQPDKRVWRNQVLASLYDAQMFACHRRDPDKVRSHQPAILDELKKLFEVEEFRKAVDAATNTPSFFRRRIELMRDMLDRVIGE